MITLSLCLKKRFIPVIHDKYILTTAILDALEKNSLECKIVKTISAGK